MTRLGRSNPERAWRVAFGAYVALLALPMALAVADGRGAVSIWVILALGFASALLWGLYRGWAWAWWLLIVTDAIFVIDSLPRPDEPVSVGMAVFRVLLLLAAPLRTHVFGIHPWRSGGPP